MGSLAQLFWLLVAEVSGFGNETAETSLETAETFEMSTELAQERLGRVLGLCRERGWRALLVYGNAWRCDYFRYISDFSILEGHAFALLKAEGDMTLFLESPVEAERAGVEGGGRCRLWTRHSRRGRLPCRAPG